MAQSQNLELLIATRNTGKIREIQEMLSGLPVRLRTLDEFADITAVEEVGVSYQENATLKALGYARQTRICALADDSGLEVEALGGMPGVYSARFGGELLSDSQRTDKLLAALSDSAHSQRAAKFICAMALVGWQAEESQEAEPRLLKLTEGTCEGYIANQVHGTNGFGFDPIFIPRGYQQTFATLRSEVKNSISHRAKALVQMRMFVEELCGQLDRSSVHP